MPVKVKTKDKMKNYIRHPVYKNYFNHTLKYILFFLKKKEKKSGRQDFRDREKSQFFLLKNPANE